MEETNKSVRDRFATLMRQARDNGAAGASVVEALEAAAQLLGELDIAYEELRVQNQALVEAQQNIEMERTRYRELFAYAPDAYLLTDRYGKILEVNLAACTLFNTYYDILIGKPLSVFIEKPDQATFRKLLRSTKALAGIEMRIRSKIGQPRETLVNINVMPSDDPHSGQLRWAMRDITDQNHALRLLDVSERRFRRIFEEANLGIVLCDAQWRALRSNAAFQAISGYNESELNALDLRALFEPEDRERIAGEVAQIEEEGVSRRFLARYHPRNGSPGWANITISLMNTGPGKEDRHILALVDDVTEQKVAEAELVEMRERLLESEENERLRLAQDLHDGPLQDLYGVVFKISNINAQNDETPLKNDLEETQEMIKHVAGTLRAICGELRPPTIANLGLERAIRSHAETVQELHGEMKIELQLTRDAQELDGHTRIALFRIYQQCMANMLRHAQATRALISFHVAEEEAILDVWDNGKGFTLPEKWVEFLRQGHYGLAGIAERVHALDGKLKIDTRPGAGTLVHVSVPKKLKGSGEGRNEDG